MTGPAGAPLDPHAIDELRATLGPTIAGRVVAAFLAELPRHLGRMRHGLAVGDAEAVFRAAHNLKGASRIVGAEELAARCLALEEIAGQGSLDGIDEAVAQVGAIAAAVDEAVRARIKS